MQNLDGKIEVCHNEQTLLALVGRDVVNEMYKRARKESDGKCECCDYELKENQKFKMHIAKINEQEPESSRVFLICDACYYLKHFGLAVEKNYVRLVNSEYSQIDLIKIQRQSNKRTEYEIQKKRISLLKQPASEYYEQIKEDPKMINFYIKIVFRNNFDWTNCK